MLRVTCHIKRADSWEWSCNCLLLCSDGRTKPINPWHNTTGGKHRFSGRWLHPRGRPCRSFSRRKQLFEAHRTIKI